MRRGAAAAWVALTLACVPRSEEATSEAATLVVVQLRDPPRVLAYDAAERPEPLVFTRAEDGDTYYLWYDRSPAELALFPDADHEVAVAPETASDAEAWPLPPPTLWSAGAARGHLLPEPLRALRIVRPPCPTFAVETSTLTGRLEGAFLLPLGDPARGGVLVGSTVRYDAQGEPRANQPTHLYYFEPGARAELLLQYSAPAVTTDMIDPIGWATADRNYVVVSTFPGELRTPIQRLYAVTATRGVAVLAEYPRDVPPRFVDMALADDGVVWATTTSAALGTFEPRSGRWTPRLAARLDQSLGCPVSTRHGVLELQGPRRGLVSFTQGPLGAFDLDEGLGVRLLAREVAAAACRSAHTALDGGGELIAFLHHVDLASAAVGLLAWRPSPDEPFRALELDIPPNGAAVAAVGDVALVSLQTVVGGGRAVAVVDLDRRRPDAPPRECPAISVDMDVRHMLRVGDRWALTGTRGHGVAWVRMVDRP